MKSILRRCFDGAGKLITAARERKPISMLQLRCAEADHACITASCPARMPPDNIGDNVWHTQASIEQ
jgi:hypothetical protein